MYVVSPINQELIVASSTSTGAYIAGAIAMQEPDLGELQHGVQQQWGRGRMRKRSRYQERREISLWDKRRFLASSAGVTTSSEGM